MTEPWELVLHHTYSGAPGLMFDHSPGRLSHGQPVNISDADYVADGVRPGSGAVRLRPTSMIRVPPSPSWNPLGCVRIEMVCETEMVRRGGVLATGDSFNFSTGNSHFGGGFSQTNGHASEVNEGGAPRPLPTNRWMTLAVQYGMAGVQVEFDGAVVARWEGWNGLLLGTTGLIIGNDRSGRHGLTGALDDLKVWRWNHRAIGGSFVERPVDESVARCWADWSRRLNDVIKSDPGCVQRVGELLPRAMFSVMTRVANLPNVEPELTELARRYQELWSQNRLTEVRGVLADVIALLRNAGFHPDQVADLQALRNDPCAASMIEQLPVDCDVAWTDLFEHVSESF